MISGIYADLRSAKRCELIECNQYYTHCSPIVEKTRAIYVLDPLVANNNAQNQQSSTWHFCFQIKVHQQYFGNLSRRKSNFNFELEWLRLKAACWPLYFHTTPWWSDYVKILNAIKWYESVVCEAGSHQKYEMQVDTHSHTHTTTVNKHCNYIFTTLGGRWRWRAAQCTFMTSVTRVRGIECVNMFEPSCCTLEPAYISVQRKSSVYFTYHTHTSPGTCGSSNSQNKILLQHLLASDLKLPIYQEPYLLAELCLFGASHCQIIHLSNPSHFQDLENSLLVWITSSKAIDHNQFVLFSPTQRLDHLEKW